MVNVDDWFPNFEMFIMIILPTLILMTIVLFIFTYWINRPRKKTPMDWMEIFKWGTLIYMIVPIYRIVDYLLGNVGTDELIEGLFVTDFRNYMILALLTGLFGLILILKKKSLEWRGVKQ